MQGKELQKAVKIYVYQQSKELNLRPRTVKNRWESLNRFFRFLKGKPFNLDNSRAYVLRLSKKKWKATSINNEIKKLKAFLNFLHRRKYIALNFSQDLLLLKTHRKQLTLIAPETIEQIIVAGTKSGAGDNARNKRIKRDMRAALRFALRTGLRVSELCGLRGCDFRLNDEIPSFFLTSKGGDEDTLPIPRDMLRELKGRVKEERVFRVTPSGLNTALKRGAQRLGITSKIHCHTLRHVFCTSLLRQGVPLQITQRLMRHKSVELTDRVYSHYVLQDLSLAQNSLKVIRDGLTPTEIFDEILKGVEKLTKDEKYRLDVSRNSEEIVLKVKVEKAHGEC